MFGVARVESAAADEPHRHQVKPELTSSGFCNSCQWLGLRFRVFTRAVRATAWERVASSLRGRAPREGFQATRVRSRVTVVRGSPTVVRGSPDPVPARPKVSYYGACRLTEGHRRRRPNPCFGRLEIGRRIAAVVFRGIIISPADDGDDYTNSWLYRF